MPKTLKHAPKHRATSPTPVSTATRASRRALRNTLVLSSIAAATTGVAVSGGLAGTSSESTAAEELTGASYATDNLDSDQLAAREERTVSRSDRRGSADETKAAALSSAEGPAVTREESLDSADPREIAKALMPEYGFSLDQYQCLDSLYVSESNWQIDADNPTSSAYGIPQALTETHEMPAGYFTSAEVQIRWGLDYIRDSYGTPCAAWEFKQGHNWY